MAPEIRIRRFRPGDGEACHGIRRDAFLGAFREELSRSAAALGAESYTPAELEGQLEGMLTFVAIAGEALVGFCAARLLSETEAEILYLYVSQDTRRSGIGSRLLGQVEACLAEEYPGIKSLTLDTAVPGYNQAFWERMGFFAEGASCCRYPGGTLPAVRLSKHWEKVAAAMDTENSNGYRDDDASLYDRQVAEHGCHGHEILFGMMYELVNPGETLLDIGIGTGLSSILFHRAGLQVSGFDKSMGMLEACGSKGFAAKLVWHDLRHVPYPFAANSFHHAVSLGVLNFYSDLSPVFGEVGRLVGPCGAFGFTVEERKPGEPEKYLFPIEGSEGKGQGGYTVAMYRHSDDHIRGLLAAEGFAVLKEFEFLADRYPEQGIDIYFKAYIARKRRARHNQHAPSGETIKEKDQ